MPSTAQAAANLANSQLSTGPSTEAGKAASSRNALKHGLTAQTVLLPGEDVAAYRRLCEDTFGCWKPLYETEKALVQHLCDTQWRITRCARLEAAVLSADTPDFKALDVISKHEVRLKKIYAASLKEAEALIFTRLANEESRLKDAMAIRRADKQQNRVTDFREFGFVFSTEQVDAAIRREDAYFRAESFKATRL